MPEQATLPLPALDALPLGAHRLVVLTDEALHDAIDVRIAFTGRAGGVSEGPYASLNCASHVGDDIDAVMANRRIVCEAVGVSDALLVVPEQVHGTDAVWTPGCGSQPVADAVLAEGTGTAVLMNFADCLPLIIVSPSGRFAVVHAGWRGAVGHIAAKAAQELARTDTASMSGYNAYIGAHIRSECFEVGSDTEERFRAEFGESVITGPRHVSLAAAVTADLVDAGFDPSRIADAALCTKCNPERFFSYRHENPCGRHAAFAVKIA